MKVENASASVTPLEYGFTATSTFSIRKALLDDVRVMAHMIGELFAIESDFKIDFEKQFDGLKLLMEQEHSDILVAKYKNTAIGMVTMQRVISSAEGGYAGLVEDVIVKEEYRGMGIGSKLIEEVVALAKKKGYVRLQLAADKDNSRALEFYAKHGFRKTNLNIYHLTGFKDELPGG